MLCGGVGGARMARALSGTVAPDRLTVVVNVGDDDYMYGAYVSADLDTVTYTLAGIEGPHGWGIAGDTFTVMDHLADLGMDTSFRLGDRDLASCLLRTDGMHRGATLSDVTTQTAIALGIPEHIMPATDQTIRTRVQIEDGTWLPFQEYFVARRHQDEVRALEYSGIEAATPAPGLIEAIAAADLVVIAPSNPPLSIWPILQIPGVAGAVRKAASVVAISPLFGGKALKGPADRVLAALGLSPGTAGILEAYTGLLSALVIDTTDADDTGLATDHVKVLAADIRISDPEAGRRFGAWLVDTMVP